MPNYDAGGRLSQIMGESLPPRQLRVAHRKVHTGLKEGYAKEQQQGAGHFSAPRTA